MRRKNININNSTIVCVVLLRLFGVMDVVPHWRNIMLMVGLREHKPPESCCHSNYRYLHQRLLPIAS